MKFLTLILLFASCSRSYDLGDNNQFNTIVLEEALVSPSWDSPVKEIVELKCASCHTRDRDQFVPQNTPYYYDDLMDKNFFDLNKREIFDRILDEENPMPPTYSTPLSPREKKALINYINQEV